MLWQEKTANLARSVQGSLTEEKLLVDLEKVIQQLELQGISIAIRRVSVGVGVTPTTLYRYPHCVSVVKKAAENQKRKRFELREDDRLQKVQEAIQRLRESELPVTIAAIAREIHTSPGSLKYYPRVRAVFEQITKGGSTLSI